MPTAKNSLRVLVSKMPFTLAVVFANVIVFSVAWIIAGTLEGQQWTTTLLRMGAQFNPLTLDNQGYRLATYMFLHGGIVHLAVNMYTLLFTGFVFEATVGTRKFAFVYLLSGLAAALASLYWNLFTAGIGTSGAISGLLGFYLVFNIFFSGKSVKPMAILLIHFLLFAAIHLILPQRMHIDYAAMFGGVMTGIVIGFFSFAGGKKTMITRLNIEYLMIPVLLLLFLFMPRYQVRYFKFFQQVVAAEDTTRHLLKEKLTDDDMRTFIRNYQHWDEILTRLDRQKGLPLDLAADTFRLRQYVALRKQENLLKKLVVQREAYAYLDSIERLQQIMRRYMDLDYGLWARIRPADRRDSTMESSTVKVLYDSNGVETESLPAAYYRVGARDSLGRWNGPFRQYDGTGRLRVKGFYKQNKRDGVFLFYSERGTCVEAGRFLEGKRFGKWQSFHGNGKIESEIFYNNGYFVNSVWDSTGTQLVVDGNGRVVQLYPDGVVKVDGEYRHGLKEGTWYGRYSNGDMYYEELFNQGKLVAGKSRSRNGQTFVYDESSLFPIPEGGFEKFHEYLKAEVIKFNSEELGHVKLSFRVLPNGGLTDFTIDQGATPVLDARAIEIVRRGPRWLPAREHGHQPVDGWAYVLVEFY